jgi:uncharacterized protein (DUF2249 family)
MDKIALDVCGLVPPEPMERILDALDALAPGTQLSVTIDREPRPLYRILESRGFSHSIAAGADRRFSLLVWRAA